MDRHGNDERMGRGTNGRRCCRFCGGDVQPPRRTFCSDACVDEWCCRSSASGARRAVAKRDKGVCSACGLDTLALERRCERLQRWIRRSEAPTDRCRRREDRAKLVLVWLGKRYGRRIHRFVLRHLSPWGQGGHLWEADHIQPVVEGGGRCGLDNLRTLCLDCHAAETAQLAARLAVKNKSIRWTEWICWRFDK